MKRSVNLIWAARMAVGLAALGLLATAANAQGRYVARFSLPCETNWNGKTLAAGDYTLNVPPLSQTPYVRVDSSNGTGRVYVPSNIVREKSGEEDVITIVRTGDSCQVLSVNLAGINEAFIYKPISEVEMASLRTGQTTKRLLVVDLSKPPAMAKH